MCAPKSIKVRTREIINGLPQNTVEVTLSLRDNMEEKDAVKIVEKELSKLCKSMMKSVRGKVLINFI